MFNCTFVAIEPKFHIIFDGFQSSPHYSYPSALVTVTLLLCSLTLLFSSLPSRRVHDAQHLRNGSPNPLEKFTDSFRTHGDSLSDRVRQEWYRFECSWFKAEQRAMERRCAEKFKELDQTFKVSIAIASTSDVPSSPNPKNSPNKRVASNDSSPTSTKVAAKGHERIKTKVRAELRKELVSKAREEWQRRLAQRGLQDEDWTEMSVAEQSAVQRTLGWDSEDDFDGDGEGVATSHQQVGVVPPAATSLSLLPVSSPTAPRPSTSKPSLPPLHIPPNSSSASASALASSTSYAIVDPSTLGKRRALPVDEDEDEPSPREDLAFVHELLDSGSESVYGTPTSSVSLSDSGLSIEGFLSMQPLHSPLLEQSAPDTTAPADSHIPGTSILGTLSLLEEKETEKGTVAAAPTTPTATAQVQQWKPTEAILLPSSHESSAPSSTSTPSSTLSPSQIMFTSAPSPASASRSMYASTASASTSTSTPSTSAIVLGPSPLDTRKALEDGTHEDETALIEGFADVNEVVKQDSDSGGVYNTPASSSSLGGSDSIEPSLSVQLLHTLSLEEAAPPIVVPSDSSTAGTPVLEMPRLWKGKEREKDTATNPTMSSVGVSEPKAARTKPTEAPSFFADDAISAPSPSSTSASLSPSYIYGPSLIGPDLNTADEFPPPPSSTSRNPTPTNNTSSNTIASSDSSSFVEADFEVFKMNVRIEKVHEFHTEAAAADEALIRDIFVARKMFDLGLYDGHIDMDDVELIPSLVDEAGAEMGSGSARIGGSGDGGAAGDREESKKKKQTFLLRLRRKIKCWEEEVTKIEAHERTMVDLRKMKENERRMLVEAERLRRKEASNGQTQHKSEEVPKAAGKNGGPSRSSGVSITSKPSSSSESSRRGVLTTSSSSALRSSQAHGASLQNPAYEIWLPPQIGPLQTPTSRLDAASQAQAHPTTNARSMKAWRASEPAPLRSIDSSGLFMESTSDLWGIDLQSAVEENSNIVKPKPRVPSQMFNDILNYEDRSKSSTSQVPVPSSSLKRLSRDTSAKSTKTKYVRWSPSTLPRSPELARPRSPESLGLFGPRSPRSDGED